MSDLPILPSNSKELYEFLVQGASDKANEIDPANLRYAIYARKSTTGDERQEQSIPDQIADCMHKVVAPDSSNPAGLKLVGKPIEEKCSAKDPDIRPKFRALLEDVRAGRVDGIIAWHPDRLSRNMKEAGEIIDLLDKGILKDLRFATSTFENSPTGKMLLGISFVLSKQYSEHLSESVSRGNRRKTEEGYFFDEQKHGYLISSGKLWPDGDSFLIIKNAFQRRIEGASQPEIANWLNSTAYMLRRKGKEPVKYKWDKDSVSKMLRDPVYAGVLKYGKSYADLADFYDFTPVVTVPEFFKINKIKDFSSAKLVSATMSNKKEHTKANLLRGIVWCGYCEKPFTSGLTSKVLKEGKTYYYNYKCETEGCEFKGKSVRANIVLDYAYNFLATNLFTTKDNYDVFVLEAQEYTAQQTKEITSSIMSLTKVISNKQNEYDNAKRLIAQEPSMSDHYDLKEIKSDLDSFSSSLEELRELRTTTKSSIMTYQKYLELFENISVILSETNDMALIDQILKKFFSNFTITAPIKDKKQGCTITHKLKEPYEGFLKMGNFRTWSG